MIGSKCLCSSWPTVQERDLLMRLSCIVLSVRVMPLLTTVKGVFRSQVRRPGEIDPVEHTENVQCLQLLCYLKISGQNGLLSC